MSATAAVERCTIPSAMTEFELPNGEKFAIDVLAFHYEVEDLGVKLKEQGRLHIDYLNEIVSLIKARTGVVLNLGEADWLKDQLGPLHAKKKQKQASDVNAMLNLAYSMASPPSPSPNTSASASN